MLLAPWAAPRSTTSNIVGWHVDPGAEAWLASLVGVVALAVVAAYVVTLAAVAQAALARLLLDPREAQLVAEVADLRRSRVDLVDAFETERRRIERDLHDGVQQRLVALTMTLGRAELDVPDGPGLVAVQDAHRQAEEALAELRGTIRGIHPQVLVDHGLAAAVHELADRASVPTSASTSGCPTGCRPRSSRRRTSWSARRSPTWPGTPVPDGPGCTAGCATRRSCSRWRTTGSAARPPSGRGSGLAGLGVRLEALGGELRVTSPSGGPTEVRMECPCAV